MYVRVYKRDRERIYREEKRREFKFFMLSRICKPALNVPSKVLRSCLFYIKEIGRAKCRAAA